VNEIIKNFKSILDESGTKPSVLESDNEGALTSKQFENFCENNDIVQLFVNPSDLHSKGVIERFNQTLRRMLVLYTTFKGQNTWIDGLEALTENYNNSVHSTTKFKPSDAENHIEEIRENFQDKREEAESKVKDLSIGSKVRLMLKKSSFDKKTDLRWTRTIHTIISKEGNHYMVSGRKNYYKGEELQKIDEAKLENEVYEDRESREIQKQTRQKRELKKAGVNEKDILPEGEKRIRRIPQRFQE
jgi:hypothetical protein